MGKCPACKVITLLGGIGALNWGVVALGHTDLVAKFLGDMTLPARVVYGLIAVSGLILLVSLVKSCPCCKKG